MRWLGALRCGDQSFRMDIFLVPRVEESHITRFRYKMRDHYCYHQCYGSQTCDGQRKPTRPQIPEKNEVAQNRVFLNLRFGKPMVCVRVAFHENDGNHENDENDEDNSDSYKQGVECWIRGNHGNHEIDENHGNPGCKPRVPQTTGLEIPEKSDPEAGFGEVSK